LPVHKSLAEASNPYALEILWHILAGEPWISRSCIPKQA